MVGGASPGARRWKPADLEEGAAPVLPLLLASGLAGLAACSGGEGSEAARWEVEHDTIADTVVVRTTAGSTWGAPRRLVPELRIGEMEGAEEYLLGDLGSLAVDEEGRIYAFDGQVPALRVYDAQGGFVRTLGREGEGPGEYKQPDPNGLAVLPDGRILLNDPGNGRINVYLPTGEVLDSWPTRGGMWTDYPLFTGPDGHVRMFFWDRGRGGSALIELSAEGVPLDTVAIPRWGYQPPTISARSGGSSQTWNVPFSATSVWTWSPRGHFIGGLGTRYAIDTFRRDGTVLRIERLTDPVPVTEGEKAAQEHRVRQAMRRLDPAWRWNGPPIGDTKPPFRRIQVARDGRVWVLLHTPGREVPAGPPSAGDAPAEAPPPPAWTEPVLFDVFEPDGRYLGQVRAPDGFQMSPRPVLGTERVWAVVEDELGVQSVVRFRMEEDGG